MMKIRRIRNPTTRKKATMAIKTIKRRTRNRTTTIIKTSMTMTILLTSRTVLHN